MRLLPLLTSFTRDTCSARTSDRIALFVSLFGVVVYLTLMIALFDAVALVVLPFTFCQGYLCLGDASPARL